MSNKVIFYIQNEFDYVFRVSTYILVIHLILVFWKREKLKPLLKST